MQLNECSDADGAGADLCAVPVLSGTVLCGDGAHKGTLTRRGNGFCLKGLNPIPVRTACGSFGGVRKPFVCPFGHFPNALFAFSGHEIERLARR